MKYPSVNRREGISRLCRTAAGALLLGALGLRQSHAEARDDIVGRFAVWAARSEDTLLDLAIQHDLGFVETAAANPGVDPWLPGAGTVVSLPCAHLLPAAPRRGIVINLADQRLYFFPPAGPVQTYPIGIAADGVAIEVGLGRVIRKRRDPVWIPPASVRAEAPELPQAVPPGPDNPLGAFALDLSWTSTAIHGTNNPFGVGRRVSHGCFRLYPDDIATLFPQVAIGTEVRIVDQPVKLGWSAEGLMLEVHPTLSQADEIEAHGGAEPVDLPDLEMLVMEAAGAVADDLDWRALRRVAREHLGIPFPILRSGRDR